MWIASIICAGSVYCNTTDITFGFSGGRQSDVIYITLEECIDKNRARIDRLNDPTASPNYTVNGLKWFVECTQIYK